MSCEGESLKMKSHEELLRHMRDHYRGANEIVPGQDRAVNSGHRNRLREIAEEVFDRGMRRDPNKALEILNNILTKRPLIERDQRN